MDICFTLLFCCWMQVVFARMLKLNECAIYDAEFSEITYNKKANSSSNMIAPLYGLQLPQCLRKCTLHPECLSVNYLRSNLTCEFLAETKCAISITMTPADGWNHFETKEKIAVSKIFPVKYIVSYEKYPFFHPTDNIQGNTNYTVKSQQMRLSEVINFLKKKLLLTLTILITGGNNASFFFCCI